MSHFRQFRFPYFCFWKTRDFFLFLGKWQSHQTTVFVSRNKSFFGLSQNVNGFVKVFCFTRSFSQYNDCLFAACFTNWATPSRQSRSLECQGTVYMWQCLRRRRGAFLWYFDCYYRRRHHHRRRRENYNKGPVVILFLPQKQEPPNHFPDPTCLHFFREQKRLYFINFVFLSP